MGGLPVGRGVSEVSEVCKELCSHLPPMRHPFHPSLLLSDENAALSGARDCGKGNRGATDDNRTPDVGWDVGWGLG